MKKMVVLILIQFLSLSDVFYADSITSTSKIRAAFWGIKPVEQGEKQLRLLKNYGVNTALVNDSGYSVKGDTWSDWGKIAGTYGIKLFPIHSFAGTEEIKLLKGEYLPYVDRSGKTFPSTPCPLDANYWNISIVERFEQLAYLSKSTSIFGIVFDTEMYGAEISIYRDLCFCDVCWREFVQSEPFFVTAKDHAAYNLKKEKRFKYLTRHNLLQRYSDFQQQRLQEILSRIEKHIHSINPDLVLGFLAYKNNWFYRGLIRGLGTETKPVLVFSETSYVRGYTQYVDQERTFIEENTKRQEELSENSQPIARYIPGLWLGRFYPEDLPSQLYNLAKHTNGYWLFTASSLWTPGQKPKPYALHGSNDEYWTAFKKANDELERFSQAPDTYQSNLPPVYPSSFYDTSQNRLFTPPSLNSFLRDTALEYIQRLEEFDKSRKSNVQNRTEVTYRGTTLFHALNNTKAAQIRITHIPLGFSDPTHYKLFDSDGALLQEGRLDHQKPSTTITLSANLSGVVSLLTESGVNATKVMFSGLPYIVEASSTFPLFIVNTVSTYDVYVKPNQKYLQLRAYCSATQTAALTVQSPDNKVNQTTEIRKFTEIRVPVPVADNTLSLDSEPAKPNPQLSLQLSSGHAIPLNLEQAENNRNFWTIAINPISSEPYETVQFYLHNEEFPYIFIKD